MEIVGRGQPVNEQKHYIVDMSEIEIDKILGVADKPHISGRYKPGQILSISKIYNKIKKLAANHIAIKAALQEIRTKTQESINELPIIEE